MALIYKITNIFLNPNKSYVGMTSRTLEERYREHISSGRNIRGSVLLAESLQYYGVINHTIELLEECHDSIALQRESFWIEELKTIQFGFNFHLSRVEHKEKTYWNNYEKAIKNISNRVVWNKNISPNDETRKKISETKRERHLEGLYKNYGHKHTEITKKNISEIVKKQYNSGRRNSGAIVYEIIDGRDGELRILKMDKVDILKAYKLEEKNWKSLYKWSKDNRLYPKPIVDYKLHPIFKIALIGGEKYYV